MIMIIIVGHYIAEKMREAQLRWFGHVERREAGEPARMAMEFKVEGSRMRGRPWKRWCDVVESNQWKRAEERRCFEQREMEKRDRNGRT